MLPIFKTLISSLFKKSSTVLYPLQNRDISPVSRGTVTIDIDKCIFCSICQKKCPTGAISVIRGDKVWEIDRYNCIQCNCCVENCPKKCLHMSSERPKASFKMEKEVFQGARIPDNATDNKNS